MAVPFSAHHIRALISGNGASLIIMENPVILTFHVYTQILHCYTHTENRGYFFITRTKKPRVHKIHSCFTTCSCFLYANLVQRIKPVAQNDSCVFRLSQFVRCFLQKLCDTKPGAHYRILTDNVASSVGQGRKRAYVHNIRYPKGSEKSLGSYKIIPL